MEKEKNENIKKTWSETTMQTWIYFCLQCMLNFLSSLVLHRKILKMVFKARVTTPVYIYQAEFRFCVTSVIKYNTGWENYTFRYRVLKQASVEMIAICCCRALTILLRAIYSIRLNLKVGKHSSISVFLDCSRHLENLVLQRIIILTSKPLVLSIFQGKI